MPRWFLSARVESRGGSVAPDIKVLDADRPGRPCDLTPELVDAVHGRDVFFAAHGVRVNQPDGIQQLNFWLDNFQQSLAATPPATLGVPVTIGILWPGDAAIHTFVDYIVERHPALASGKLVARFLNKHFTGAASLSFASHSLGARVVLETIRGLTPELRVRRVLLMAAAIESDCLTKEFKDVSNKLNSQQTPPQLSILASARDGVLAWAFPLGSPIRRIIDHSHPYFRAALGHEGPAAPPSSPPIQSGWQIPEDFDYGHHNYLPGERLTDFYPGDVNIPPNQPIPPANTPPLLAGDENLWKPAFSAGFASARFRRP